MISSPRQSTEKVKKEKLHQLYQEYEKDMLTIHRCQKELEEIKQRRTKEYEQKYLETAGVL